MFKKIINKIRLVFVKPKIKIVAEFSVFPKANWEDFEKKYELLLKQRESVGLGKKIKEWLLQEKEEAPKKAIRFVVCTTNLEDFCHKPHAENKKSSLVFANKIDAFMQEEDLTKVTLRDFFLSFMEEEEKFRIQEIDTSYWNNFLLYSTEKVLANPQLMWTRESLYGINFHEYKRPEEWSSFGTCLDNRTYFVFKRN